jgi:hypothetical protein
MTLCDTLIVGKRGLVKVQKLKNNCILTSMSEMQVKSQNNVYVIDIIHSLERRQLVHECLRLLTAIDESEAAITMFEENAMYVDETYLKWLIENLVKIKKAHYEEE